MRPRDFATVSPTFYKERAIGPFLVSHERYRGLFAGEHAHAETQIQVFLKGRIHLQVGESRQLVGPGSVLVMPAGTVHGALHLDDDLELVNVLAPADWLVTLAREIEAVEPTDHRTLADPFLWALAQRLTHAVDAGGPAAERVLSAGLELIGITLAAPPARESQGRPQGGPHGDQDPRIVRAVDRILRDYAEPLSVEAMAAAAAMTPRHFNRCFKAAVGVSPKRFILATRIRVARELLERSRSTVTEIAQDVGFSDATHFIRTFREAVGETPTAYRRQRLAVERLSGQNT